MVMMSPVPRTVPIIPIIPVVPWSDDDRRGVDDGWRWGDNHRCRGDDDRDRQG